MQHCKGSLADQSKRTGVSVIVTVTSTDLSAAIQRLVCACIAKNAASCGIESAIASVVMRQAREFATTTAAAAAITTGAKSERPPSLQERESTHGEFSRSTKISSIIGEGAPQKNRVVGATASCCTVCLSCHCHMNVVVPISSGSITKATAARFSKTTSRCRFIERSSVKGAAGLRSGAAIAENEALSAFKILKYSDCEDH